MRIEKLDLEGLALVHEDPIHDSRGEFSRVFCAETFSTHNLVSTYKQINRSTSLAKGTLRGLHFQVDNSAEAKFVRVIKGRIFDVAVDVRPESSNYLKWLGVELSDSVSTGFYLSPGFAHGIITLEDDTRIEYLVSEPYNAKNERGFRWDDPAININWPMEPVEISEKDCSWGLIR